MADLAGIGERRGTTATDVEYLVGVEGLQGTTAFAPASANAAARANASASEKQADANSRSTCTCLYHCLKMPLTLLKSE